MDFVGKLPESDGFNAILVITDAEVHSCKDYLDSRRCGQCRYYGLSTTDCGPQFASAFQQALNKSLDVRLRISTAHHPQREWSSH